MDNYICVSSATRESIEGADIEELQECLEERHDRCGGYEPEYFNVFETVYVGYFKRNADGELIFKEHEEDVIQSSK